MINCFMGGSHVRRYGALLLLAGDGDVERLLGFDFVDFVDLDDIVLLLIC